MRRHNLGVVLRLLAEQGPRSRARIAAETSLNKSTVSSLVADLMSRGLVIECGSERPGTVGRPAVRVALNGSGVVALGLEVNVDHLAVCAVDLEGTVRRRVLVPGDNRGAAPEEVLSRLAALARRTVERLGEHALTPVGLTVAVPGLVDITRGMLFVAPNLGWKQVPVAALLAERLDLVGPRIRVDNEANLGALAERWQGAAQSIDDFVYVSGEIGVGAGVVIGGELYRGADGFGGELGHVPLQPGGAACACGGTGCLETLVGQEAVLRLAGVDPATASSPSDPDGPVAVLARRAEAGDRRTLEALVTVGEVLGVGLAAHVNLFNPRAVVLGGFFAALAPWLIEPVERELARRVLAARWSRCAVLAGRLRGDAAVRGAAALSLREVLADPATVEHHRPPVHHSSPRR